MKICNILTRIINSTIIKAELTERENNMEYFGGKHERILSLYSNLMDGRRLNVKKAAEYYKVSTKTIKRDIDDIRNFLSEKSAMQGEMKELIYDRQDDNYKIIGDSKLTAKELFAVCKILLESRSLTKDEFMPVMDKIIDCCATKDNVAHIKDMVANEKYHYIEPRHKLSLIDRLWDISIAVREHKKMKVVYERLTEPRHCERIVEPVGIMFSDYYFYLTAFIPEKQTKNPTIYRIDRLKDYEVLDETFRVPYSNRFEEGEFRKRIQFMYGGDLMHVEFKYYGESVEAVLDRLPTAEIVSHRDNVYIIKAEVFGRGIKPWILSQTDRIEVLKPANLRKEIKELVEKIRNIYC